MAIKKRILAGLMAAWLLTGRSPGMAEEPFLLEDPDNGRWEYRSAELTLTITRCEEIVDTGGRSRIREYCVADIQASPASPLYPIMTEATKKLPAGYRLVRPDKLVEKHQPIFAMSDDLYGIRLQKYKYKGIVIREGEILATRTHKSSQKRYWPVLDTLAVFGDGSMKACLSDAYTAEEYLAMGARQVFSFGPVLLSGGEIPDQVLDLEFYPYHEPRAAIGMVEPWHYIALVVRGRPRDQFIGARLDWVARKMQEMGCVEALNLDGGQTATMFFNGKAIIMGDRTFRSQGSLICFGRMAN